MMKKSFVLIISVLLCLALIPAAFAECDVVYRSVRKGHASFFCAKHVPLLRRVCDSFFCPAFMVTYQAWKNASF